MIPLLPKWNLHANRPTFYDTDSVTMLELAGRLHGSMNELITDYNSFVENVNKVITEFTNSTEKNNEVFETALRQEFQDFIDIINLKIKEQDLKVAKAVDDVKQEITEYINGKIEVQLQYDPENEEINLVATYGEEI